MSWQQVVGFDILVKWAEVGSWLKAQTSSDHISGNRFSNTVNVNHVV